MHSIRFKLTVLSIVSIAAVVSAGFGAVYVLIRNQMIQEFDRLLVDRAHALAAMVEWDEQSLSFIDSDRATFSEDHQPRDEYFRLFIADTGLRIDSPSILERPFPEKPLPGAGIQIFEETNASARPPLRLVQLPFSLDAGASERSETPAAFGAKRRDLHLVLGWNPAVVYERLGYIRWSLVICLLLVLATTAAVLWHLIRRQLNPLVSIGRQLTDISEQQLDHRFDEDEAPREIKPVLERLNRMMGRLEVAFDREKAFTSNAAHELRTPLAGLRSTLEVALSRERDPDSYQKSLSQALDICRQMHPMVENLLAISRVDSGSWRMNPEDLDLTEVVQEAIASFQPRAEARSLQIKRTWQAPHRVRVDRSMLQMVINNLLENAISYSPEGGRIEMAIVSAGPNTRLKITNTAESLSPEDLDHVFEPFWRHDQARRQAGLHAGLGLSICRKILTRLGGRIDVLLNGVSEFEAVVELPADA
ncbi:MAG: ATP-binding protein [Phycisphaeraceae bacterium]|nr:ATP-binding protein [Phycisphaeraceae bacterium]